MSKLLVQDREGFFRKTARVLGLLPKDAGFWNKWFGLSNTAGVAVTVDTAMQLAAVWACVRLLSETMATLPLVLYRKDAKGDRTPATDHALYTILHDKPNDDMSSFDFIECLMSCLCLWGNFFALKVYTSRGRIVSLLPIRPDCVMIHVPANGYSLEYWVRTSEGLKKYTKDEIFHVKGFSTDGMIGMSTIAQARQSLGTALAADRAAGTFFRNGLRAGGFLISPVPLDDDQREEMRARLGAFSGVDAAGKTMVLEGGWKYETMGLPPGEAQLLESRQFGVEEVCRWFRVQPFLIGHTEKTTTWGTGLEQITLAYLVFTLTPYARRIEQTISRLLLTPVERLTMSAEFTLEGLLRADSAGRSAYLTAMTANGIMRRNEARKLENLPRDTDPNADKLTVQSNMVLLEDLHKLKPGKTPVAAPTPTPPVKP